MKEVAMTCLCWECDRPLDQLDWHCCLHCGRHFNPADPRTVNGSGQPLRRWKRWLLRAPAWPAVVLAAGIMFGNLWPLHSPIVAMRAIW